MDYRSFKNPENIVVFPDFFEKFGKTKQHFQLSIFKNNRYNCMYFISGEIKRKIIEKIAF